MKTMILAAGRGRRMGALTDSLPKPLLKIGAYALIEWQIMRLVAAGLRDIVINLGYRGEQIHAFLGDGSRYGVRIDYSRESQEGLETAGGIRRALPLLAERACPLFLCVNADVWIDIDYDYFIQKSLSCLDACKTKGHLLCVANPLWKAQGDLNLDVDGYLSCGDNVTFAGVSLLHRELFADMPTGRQALAPWLRRWTGLGYLSGSCHFGVWQDVGTPERLQELRESLPA